MKSKKKNHTSLSHNKMHNRITKHGTITINQASKLPTITMHIPLEKPDCFIEIAKKNGCQAVAKKIHSPKSPLTHMVSNLKKTKTTWADPVCARKYSCLATAPKLISFTTQIPSPSQLPPKPNANEQLIFTFVHLPSLFQRGQVQTIHIPFREVDWWQFAKI